LEKSHALLIKSLLNKGFFVQNTEGDY
jgi:hypothetical protein